MSLPRWRLFKLVPTGLVVHLMDWKQWTFKSAILFEFHFSVLWKQIRGNLMLNIIGFLNAFLLLRFIWYYFVSFGLKWESLKKRLTFGHVTWHFRLGNLFTIQFLLSQKIDFSARIVTNRGTIVTAIINAISNSDTPCKHHTGEKHRLQWRLAVVKYVKSPPPYMGFYF